MPPRQPDAAPTPVFLGARDVMMAALVVVATLGTYLPAMQGAFIWNDSDYVTAPALRSLAGLEEIWTRLGATEQYYPLLHSFFWVQHKLWGDGPLGYHVVTLLLHTSAAVLFALFLRRLAIPGAWLAALLFALHPVHVESVAWITEQKNTLSIVFYLATAIVYLRFDEDRRPRDYYVALGLFVLSLLCKTVTATLPAALLVVFWWKRGQLEWRRDFRPLISWLVLGAATGLFSSWVEQHYLGAKGADFELSLVERGLVAGRAFWFYCEKLVWPFDLNFIYSRWTPDAAVAWQWLFPLGVLALAGGLWALRRRTRAPLAAFLLFAGTLFPVLGFVNLYGGLYSFVWDHWQYLPDLAPLALLAATFVIAWNRVTLRWRPLGPALAGVLVVTLSAASWQHTKVFHDDLTLYRTTLAKNPSCWMAHNNLANTLLEVPGQETDAIAHYEAALRAHPDYADAEFNLANVLMRTSGGMDQAIAHYEAALRIQPEYRGADLNLGIALLQIPERLSGAIAHFEAALRIEPDDPSAHCNLGIALLRIPGRKTDAVAHFEAALRVTPDHVEAHNNLGNALSQVPGREVEARRHYEAALKRNPMLAEPHYNLANMLMTTPGGLPGAIGHYQSAIRIQPEFPGAALGLGVAFLRVPGRLPDAIHYLEEALRLRPNDPVAHYNLGIALMEVPGRERDALAHFQTTLRTQPDDVEVHVHMGNLMLRVPGRISEAIAHFEAALRGHPDDPGAHIGLGIALSSTPGRVSEAITHFESALRLAPDDPTAHYNLGTALAELPERRAEAIPHFEAVLRAYPDDRDAHYSLGNVFARLRGRDAEALKQFEAALLIDPSFEPARQMATQLRKLER